MSYYENVFIARQDVSTSAVDALAERFAAVIKENGGEVTKKEYWGLRSLAYRIKKNRKGHYVLFNIDAPSPAVQEMERQMRIDEDVLRFLTLKVDEFEEGPSVVMQSRAARDERPRREDRDRRQGRHDRGAREESKEGDRAAKTEGLGKGEGAEESEAPGRRPPGASQQADAAPEPKGETAAEDTQGQGGET